MLNFGNGHRIFLAKGATDMRKSFDTLAALVQGALGEDPYSVMLR
jgi:transposase